MSYGTRKAIGGGIAASRFAAEGAVLFIEKMNAARSDAEIQAAMDWAKRRGGWFFRSSEDDARMRSALRDARARVAGIAAARPEREREGA